MNKVYPARSAEKMLWSEEFGSYADVHQNSGTLVGSPVIDAAGTHLDGLTQYGTWAIPAGLLAVPKISFEVKFTPDFAADDGLNHYLWDSSNPHRYNAVKFSNDKIYVNFPGGGFHGISLTTYGAYWLVGEANTFIVSAESGNNNVYLNGHVILSADGTAWNRGYPTEFFIGSNYGAAFKFPGIIHHLKVRKRLLTQLDVDAIQAGSLYSYVNKSSVYLDMKTATAKAGTVRGTTEKLVDSDMEAVGTGDWAAGGGGSVAKTAINPKTGSQALRISGGVGAVGRQAVNNTISGKRYRIRGWLRSDGVNTPAVIDAFSAVVMWQGTVSTAWQFFDITAVVGTSGFGYRWVSGAGTYIDVDDCSVVETDELLSDSSMEATGTGEWAAGSSATLTKETGSPYQGLQVLRVAYNGTSVPFAYQVIGASGDVLHIAGRARGDGTYAPGIRNASGLSVWTGSTSTDWQHFNLTVTLDGTYLRLVAIATGAGYCEFDAIQARPVLARTLDKSPHGRTCLLGDGVTANTIPDFLGTGKGFELDGINQFMKLPQASGIFGTTGQSIILAFKPGFDIAIAAHRYLLDSTATARYMVYKDAGGSELSIFLGGTFIGGTVGAGDHWRVNGRNVLIISSVSGNTDARLNDALVMSADSTAWTPGDTSEIYLGCSNVTSAKANEVLLDFIVFPFKLSPIQQTDLALSLLVIP